MLLLITGSLMHTGSELSWWFPKKFLSLMIPQKILVVDDVKMIRTFRVMFHYWYPVFLKVFLIGEGWYFVYIGDANTNFSKISFIIKFDSNFVIMYRLKSLESKSPSFFLIQFLNFCQRFFSAFPDEELDKNCSQNWDCCKQVEGAIKAQVMAASKEKLGSHKLSHPPDKRRDGGGNTFDGWWK